MQGSRARVPVVVGSGQFRYQALPDWGRLPKGWAFIEVAGIAIDSHDRVFVFNRGEHPIMVFDRDGRFLSSWGEGQFARAHGLTIGPDDAVYCTDDLDHVVRKFTPDGQLLLTLGTPGRPSDTGVIDIDYRTIRRPGPPFNRPTNVALSGNGSLYVADGYGNACIHKFAAGGTLLFSWGGPGDGPGEFNVPHGIAVDREGLVYVADRENGRIQIFTPDGEYVTQWTDVSRPMQVFIDRDDAVFVVELGQFAGRFPWHELPSTPIKARLSIFNRQGELQARWGGDDPTDCGDFFAPHDLCIDSRGDLYVGEVVRSAGGASGLVSPECHALQKFVRMG